MKIAVLGTGMVGTTLGTKLVALGHEVRMGSRSVSNEAAAAWVKAAGKGASAGTFGDAAAFGELAFNCTQGTSSVAALEAAGEANLAGKVLVDVANPLDFSTGHLRLTISNGDSLGETIQRAFPKARVVKALNTMNCGVMVEPSLVSGAHDVFMCGNDFAAKDQVAALLRAFGWRSIHDLGDITKSRGMEMILPLWLDLMKAFGNARFNFHIAR